MKIKILILLFVLINFLIFGEVKKNYNCNVNYGGGKKSE